MKKSINLFLLLSLVVYIFSPLTVDAGTITVNSAYRRVSALGSLYNSPTIGTDFKQVTNSNMGLWEATAEVSVNVDDILNDPGYIAIASSSAHQRSDITINNGILDLTASASYPANNGHARANVITMNYPLDLTFIYSESNVNISIDFTIDGAAQSLYDAYVFTEVGNINYNAVPQIYAALFNKDTNQYVFEYKNNQTSSFSDELAAGNYTFNFNLIAFAEPSLWLKLSHLDFSVTPVEGAEPPVNSVPEPSTLLLLGSGLLGLVGFGRRRFKK